MARRSVWSLLVAGLLGLMVGCGSGSLQVIEAPSKPVRVSSARLAELPVEFGVNVDDRAMFGERLERAIFERAGFVRGEELTIEYRLLGHDEGNKALRFWIGFGAGRGKVVAEAIFRDSGGGKIAHVHSTGTVNSGAITAGTMKDAYDRLAREIADYAAKNFKKKR